MSGWIRWSFPFFTNSPIDFDYLIMPWVSPYLMNDKYNYMMLFLLIVTTVPHRKYLPIESALKNKLFHSEVLWDSRILQKQPPRGVPRKRCSEIICSKFTGEHPYRSTISIKLQSNFIKIAIRHGCFPASPLVRLCFLYVFQDVNFW